MTEVLDLLEKQLWIIGDFPALVAKAEDDGCLRVVLLAKTADDLLAALIHTAVQQIAPELLLCGLGSSDDLLPGTQEALCLSDLCQRFLGGLGIYSSMTAFFLNAPQNSWVFLASNSMKRSARCMYRCARSWAGVILTGSTGSGAGAVCGGSAFGGSWRSGADGPGAGTLFGGLALFLLPGGLFAWGASRAQQPTQAPVQALGQYTQALEQAPLAPLALAPLALAPLALARAPRQHFPPFLFRKTRVDPLLPAAGLRRRQAIYRRYRSQ